MSIFSTLFGAIEDATIIKQAIQISDRVSTDKKNNIFCDYVADSAEVEAQNMK